MIPVNHLQNTTLFHMTHVENLSAILASHHLAAKNLVQGRHRVSMASEDVQSRRAKKLVPKPPGGVLHDYVPFYFAPRAPMLYCNHVGSISNACLQSDIIYLVTTAQLVAQNASFVFYDRHAVLGYAECFNRIEDLSKIDWRIFFEQPHIGNYAKYWQDRDDVNHPHWSSRREIRQAEFLVHEQLDFSMIQAIGVQNTQVQSLVLDALQGTNYSKNVNVELDWYF